LILLITIHNGELPPASGVLLVADLASVSPFGFRSPVVMGRTAQVFLMLGSPISGASFQGLAPHEPELQSGFATLVGDRRYRAD